MTNRVSKKCETCNKLFSGSKVHMNIRKNCSKECMAIDYKNKMKLNSNPNWRGGISFKKGGSNYRNPRILKVKIIKLKRTIKIWKCIKCEKIVSKKRKYCGKDCRVNKYFKFVKRCSVCLNEYSTWKSKPKKYCSRRCYGKMMSILQTGSGSHLWKGGMTDWKMRLRTHPLYKEWRNKIFKRDNYSCQSCLKKSSELNKGKLTAHHIVFFKDNPRLALKISNGITLCWQCHRDFHKMVRHGILAEKESILTQQCRDFFKSEPGVCMYKIHGDGIQTSGMPDFLGVVAGVATGIELKVFPNFVTPIQNYQLKLIQNAGGKTFVCYSIDEVKRVIFSIKDSLKEVQQIVERE